MRYILSIVFCICASGIALAQPQVSETRTLISDTSHVVTMEIRGKDAVFIMESINDLTNDRDMEEPWTKVDFAGMRIDANNNNLIEKRVDFAFGLRQKTDVICPQLIYSETASSGCGQLRTTGKAKVEFKKTANQDKPHPVYEFIIPVSELTRESRTIGFVFRFHSANSGFSSYPASIPGKQQSFDETIKVDF